MTSLLPPNRTPLETGLEAAVNDELRINDIPVRDLWNPDTCPLALLPWLAWSLSVDLWNDQWSEDAKRNVVRSAVEVHRQKGTMHAVRTALEAIHHDIKIEEWFEYNGSPYRFRIDVGLIPADSEPYDYECLECGHYGLATDLDSSLTCPVCGSTEIEVDDYDPGDVPPEVLDEIITINAYVQPEEIAAEAIKQVMINKPVRSFLERIALFAQSTGVLAHAGTVMVGTMHATIQTE